MKAAKDFLTPEMYYKAIEGSDSGLWVCDMSQGLCYLSNRYYIMLGYTPGEFEGTIDNLFALLHPDDVEKSQQKFAELFSGQSETYRNEVQLKTKAGTYLPILTQGVVERDELGAVSKFIGWNIDISSLKAAQKALDDERALNIAQSRLAQLGMLAGGVAHEINNPLTTILGRSELLRRSISRGTASDPAKLLEDLQVIQQSSRRISEIINGLRTMVEGGVDQKRERLWLTQVVEEVLGLCQSQLEGQGIHWHIKLPQPGPSVKANFTLMSQVFLNLIKNAADALENRSQKNIWIEVKVEDQAAHFIIEDDGSGVKPEDREKLMMPFFTTKRPGQGTGLGLSISKAIVLSHGGDLHYQHAEGRSRFVVQLPLLGP
jgi:PAS domain S-box-containing protein